jgi:hypothetical protein
MFINLSYVTLVACTIKVQFLVFHFATFPFLNLC